MNTDPGQSGGRIVAPMSGTERAGLAQGARPPGVQRAATPGLELFTARDFLASDLCAALIDLTDAARRPSTIADFNGDRSFRTSETGDLPADHPAVIATDSAIAALLGLDPAYGEPLQGQRYAIGQEFKAHTDYFEPDGPDYARFCDAWGQRTWTAMIYLNAPTAGGATRFVKAGKTVHPEAGKLLAWNNRRPDGGVNGETLHHGMKVRAGVKYVVTKWYRERPCR